MRSLRFSFSIGYVVLLSTFVLTGKYQNISAEETDVSAPTPAKAPFDAKQAAALQAAWADHLDAKVAISNSQGTEMVLIPPGEFMMGSTPQQSAEAAEETKAQKIIGSTLERVQKGEQPQHLVKIAKPFRMAATEVTIEQFAEFVKATKYVTDAERYGSGNSVETDPEITKKGDPFDFRFPGFKQGANHAVSQVSWNDAVVFCNWLSEKEKLPAAYEKDAKYGWKLIEGSNGYRLPTEAEWEYAARAGTTTHFSFGDDYELLPKYAWFGFKSGSSPARPVGSKLPNPFGLYDMHGNIGEWCEDFYDPEGYPEHPVTKPSANASPTQRVIRGGDWWTNSVRCRSAFRGYGEQVNRSDDLGFRLVRGI